MKTDAHNTQKTWSFCVNSAGRTIPIIHTNGEFENKLA